jgi:D-alanyl-D-alanine carboxypeptidase/D-alanyl-D-alanine-endopeptidase (penicillin-binding protein 4)
MKTNALQTCSLLLITCSFLLPACSVQKQATKTVTAKKQSIEEFAQTYVLSDSNFATAHVGISLYDYDVKQYVYNYQGNKYFIPASNTKLLTCYAAMKYLGDSLTALAYCKEGDDITVKFTGDPTLLHPDFLQQPAFDFIKKNHKNITIVLPDWEAAKFGNGWAWNDYGDDYMAERSAMPVFGNTVRFKQNGNSVVAMPRSFKDSLIFMADVRTEKYKINRAYTENDFELKESNTKFSNTEIPFVTSFELNAALLEDSLQETINVMEVEAKAKNWKYIHSQPTDSLLKIMMHRSDNFFAEQTLMMVSNERLNVMNDWKAIDTLVKTDYKDLPQKPKWVDGSGLSRYNLVSPQDFVTVLAKMKSDFSWNRIATILPTGDDGTLKGYYKNYVGKIYAKTGTLSNNVALSGFIITNSGKQFIFSVMVNNHQTSATAIRRAVEKFITSIIEKY